MTHVLHQEYEDAFFMICTALFKVDDDAELPPGEDFVGLGRGVLKDGTVNTAAQQAEMVDCPVCAKMFPFFNDGKTLAEVAGPDR
jgi:hypothetical protein